MKTKTRIPRLLAALAVILTLQGCAETIVAGGAAVVVTAFDPRPITTIVSDQTSDFRVGRLLKANKYVGDDAHINTLVYNDTLLLTGEVRSNWLKKYVSDIMGKIQAIKKVHNYLDVRKPSPEESRTADATLTTRIMAQLTANDIDDAEVRVVTESKTVYLLGLVDKATQEKVLQITRHVREIRGVVPLFETAG